MQSLTIEILFMVLLSCSKATLGIPEALLDYTTSCSPA